MSKKILTAVFCVCILLSFVSCQSNETLLESFPDYGFTESEKYDFISSEEQTAQEPNHVHSFSDATCTQPAQCYCGETSGKALGHQYSGEYCTRCYEKNPNYVPKIEVSYLSMDHYREEIYIGKSVSLKCKVYPDNASNKSLKWSSSNPSVAKVNSSGKVTGISAGEATITAMSTNGETAACEIVVKEDITAKCSLQLPKLPQTINYYDYSGKIQTTSIVTKITYQFEEYSDSTVILTAKFSGKKTYDYRGAGQSDSCKVGWKLYDGDGNVFRTGTFTTPNLAEGESYSNKEEDLIYNFEACEPGKFRLELSHVN